MGAPRQSRRDSWAPSPAVRRYRAFRDDVRRLAIPLPASGARITFLIAMPPSWPKRRRDAMRGTPHQQRPDCDNLLKALADAVYRDAEDSHVWHLAGLAKLWADSGAIRVEVPNITPENRPCGSS